MLWLEEECSKITKFNEYRNSKQMFDQLKEVKKIQTNSNEHQ